MNSKKLGAISAFYKDRGLNVSIKTEHDMMALYHNWFRGHVEEFHDRTMVSGTEGDNVSYSLKSTQMAKQVAEAWSSTIYNENTSITYEDTKINEILQKTLVDNNFKVNFSDLLEKTFALGNGLLVQYFKKVDGEDKLAIDYIAGVDFIIGDYVGGVANSVLAVNEYIKEDNYYTHIIWHRYEKGNYVVQHDLFESPDELELGSPVSIRNYFGNTMDHLAVKYVHDNKEYEIFTIVEDCSRPWFQTIRPNISNNQNIRSTYGMSIYGNCIDYLQTSDLIFSEYHTEYELSTKSVFIASQATSDGIDLDENGRPVVNHFHDKHNPKYVNFPVEDINEPIKEYTPAIRDEAYQRGMEYINSMIGLKTGLGKNYFNMNSGMTAATATEVNHNNKDLFKNKAKHELLLTEKLKDLVEVLIEIHRDYLGDVDKSHVIDRNKINIKWDDSIYQDDEVEYQKDKALVESGLLAKFRFLMQHKGLSEKEAKELINEARAEQLEEDDAILSFNEKDTVVEE